MTKHYFTYLALGDSYTIGESVPLHESFPYLTVQMLRKAGMHVHPPEIVAKTGWSSDELAEHLLHMQLNDHYDFVTLLIGVNNQYRGLAAADFKTDLTFLIKKAIHLANHQPKKVILMSIPNWALTPFAADKKTEHTSTEINEFNQVVAQLSKQFHTSFLDISSVTNQVAEDTSLLASDQLHYSAKAHLQWAEKLAALLLLNL